MVTRNCCEWVRWQIETGNTPMKNIMNNLLKTTWAHISLLLFIFTIVFFAREEAKWVKILLNWVPVEKGSTLVDLLYEGKTLTNSFIQWLMNSWSLANEFSTKPSSVAWLWATSSISPVHTLTHIQTHTHTHTHANVITDPLRQF